MDDIKATHFNKVFENFTKIQIESIKNSSQPFICYDGSGNSGGFGNKIKALVNTLTLAIITNRAFKSIDYFTHFIHSM